MKAQEKIKELNIRRAIEGAYEREKLVLDGEPLLFKLYKSQGIGMPSAFDRCLSLNEDARLFDAGRFWIIRSDDLGDILADNIEAHPENWIGTITEEGLDCSGADQGDLQAALEAFLDDWIEWLDLRQAAEMDIERRREFFGSASDITFKRLAALGDYRTRINEREFDYIEAAVEFLRKEAPWFEEGENQDFAAIMLATEDRDGLRFSSSEANGEHRGQLDPLFDRWMNL